MGNVSRVPATLRRYEVPAAVLAATSDALRSISQGIRESVVLWPGRVVSDTTARVTRLLVPTQTIGPLHFNVSLQERMRLVTVLAAAEELLLVQLHTHPRQAFHSEVDDRLALIKHVGAVSVVIPHFARGWTGDFAGTSVNVHEGASVWRELPPTDACSLLQVVS